MNKKTLKLIGKKILDVLDFGDCHEVWKIDIDYKDNKMTFWYCDDDGTSINCLTVVCDEK